SPHPPPPVTSPLSLHDALPILMLLATVCWAANIVAGKKALLGFGPLALAQLRALGAALVFLLAFRLLAFRAGHERPALPSDRRQDRKSTRLNSSHLGISYAVFC